MFDSVRTRLTLWYAAVLALSLIAFALVVYYAAAASFYERRDESLRSTAETVASAYLEEFEEAHSLEKAGQIVLTELAFPSRYVAEDIAATAAQKNADLVLIVYHKPVWGRALLGGTVHNVMSQCPCDVGVFINRGFQSPSRVLVPYGGGQHDRLALELAARIARTRDASVSVLFVSPPGGAMAARLQSARDTVKSVFGDIAVDFRHVQDTSPVAVVLRESARFDLVIVGVSEEWGLESRLFGWRPERIARDAATSLLIVRKTETVTVPAEVGAELEPDTDMTPLATS